MDNNNTEITKTNEAAAPEPAKKVNIIGDFVEIVESTLITIFVIVMIFTYLLHPVNIVGGSMKPTLNKNSEEWNENSQNDKILMNTVFTDVKYGDILIIDNNRSYLLDESNNVRPNDQAVLFTDECLIKRVIAVGGQTLELRDGSVYVDGEKLDEPYVMKGAMTYDEGAFGNQYPITIPEGYYFVMGDNRQNSSDSRHADIGLIKKDQIYGKAIVRFSPIKNFHILINSWKESAND